MRFGIGTFATDETIHPARLGAALEERGFEMLFLAEHSHIPTSRATPYPGGGDLPRPYYRVIDPFVALAAASTTTERLMLGTGVTLLIQRDPIHTAKEVASLDWISGGRAVFGIGAGWNVEEMRNHGTDPRGRGKLLAERMAAIIELWTKDEAEFHGEYVDFDPVFAWPKPVRQPHPPVYVGGGSPAALARAKRFGGWMPNGVADPDEAAAQVARAGGEIPVIASTTPAKPELVAAYREAGAEGITFSLPHVPEAEALRILDDLAKLID